MAVPLLYVPDVSGSELTLPEGEARHAIKVLRLRKGDELRMVDGKGGIYKARVQELGKKECRVRVEDERHGFKERSYHLTIGVAPPKNDQRFEWFLEKATEMGIDRIVPILSARSEKTRTKPERFQKILVAAMKQSNKAHLPHLDEPTSLESFLEEEAYDESFVAHCYQKPERTPLKDAYQGGERVRVLIGPEGDLTPEEVQESLQKGFSPVSLGKAVLRTETAAVAACHTIALMKEEE